MAFPSGSRDQLAQYADIPSTTSDWEMDSGRIEAVLNFFTSSEMELSLWVVRPQVGPLYQLPLTNEYRAML
jgi:hypothetical protein